MDSSVPGEPPQILYHNDGTPATMEQFRLAVIMRDESREKIGYQPTPSTWFADPEIALTRGEHIREMMTTEKDIYVIVFDDSGVPNVVQLNQEVFF